MKIRKPHLEFAPKELSMTDDEFEGLHNALDHTRANSETVRVDKLALSHLLMDYGRFASVLDDLERMLRHPLVSDDKAVDKAEDLI